MAPKWLFPVLVLISASAAEILTVNEAETVLQYPNDFNCSKTWEIIPSDEGLGVILIINSTILDSDDEDHLIFSAAASMDGENESVFYLTGSLTDVWLALPLVEKAYLNFSAKNCADDKHVTLTLKQYERRAEEPPVTPPSPYPPSGIETQIVVHLTGKTADIYKDPVFLTNFTTFIQKAAFEFCNRKNITYNPSKPANETVFIDKIQMCSDKWPDYEQCVQILLSIYVTIPRTEYELSVTHLEEFWSELEQKEWPSSLGVQPYEFPNVALQILYWLGWLLLAIVITSAVGYALWRVESKSNLERIRLLNEEEERRKESIFRGVQMRHQQDKPLKPAKHQKIPEFMKNNHDSISKAATAPTTTRFKLKKFFGKNDETKVDQSPSLESPPKTPGFYYEQSVEETSET